MLEKAPELSVQMHYSFSITGTRIKVREVISWLVLNCEHYVFGTGHSMNYAKGTTYENEEVQINIRIYDKNEAASFKIWCGDE
jgi:hypothetical protein